LFRESKNRRTDRNVLRKILRLQSEALAIIDECHQRWVRLKSGLTDNSDGFYIPHA